MVKNFYTNIALSILFHQIQKERCSLQRHRLPQNQSYIVRFLYHTPLLMRV